MIKVIDFYETLSDYKQLVELLDAGKQVICFVEKNGLFIPAYSEAVKLKFHRVYVVDRNELYVYADTAEEFMEQCREFKVAFIPPTKEPSL